MQRSYLLVGRHRQSYYESIAHWDLSSLPYDLDIVCATAHFCIAYHNPSCPKVIEAYPIISRWKPSLSSMQHHPLITATPVACATISKTTKQLSFELTTLVKEWQNNETANLGILFKMQQPVFPDDSLLLFSGNYRDSSCWPFIEITYNPPDVIPCVYQSDTIDVLQVVDTAGDWSYTAPLDILTYNYTYTVSNIGASPAIVRLQVSAEGHYWLDQSAQNILSPAKSVALVADTITRYARVAFCSLPPCKDTTLKIAIQGRT